MKHMKTIILGLAMTGLAHAATPSKVAEVVLEDSTGKKIGTALLTETDHGVKISLRASGLTPGAHGIHFHEIGKCETPSFKSAGGHFQPLGHEHGLQNPEGPHAGDLPNLQVNAKGEATAEMLSTQVKLDDSKMSLLKSGGTALVIHAKPDDQHTSPSGNSGDRIACGVVKPKS